jgi:alpha-N-arabinofuranosidase
MLVRPVILYVALVLTLVSGCFASGAVVGNLLANPGFELPFLPDQWTYGPGVASQGIASRTQSWKNSGSWSLMLQPNSTNETMWMPYDYAVVQNLDLKKYKGSPIFYAGWIRAEGGATAYLRVLAADTAGNLTYREVSTSSSQAVYWQDIMDVPNSDLKTLMFMCSVKGTSGAAYFDDVVASSEMGHSIQIGQYDPGPPLFATIGVDVTKVVRQIPPTLFGMNLEWVFDGQTIWNPFQGQLNPPLVNLGSDLGVTMWRYPGGVFANYYHWMNGIGPQATRPISPTSPGEADSLNGFGTDEALEFTALTGATDMMITVNANDGTPEEAAAWVRYVNNGTRYVKYWEIGNEFYLRLQNANGTPRVITPEEYAQIFNKYAAAMKAADPTIEIGADTEFHYPFRGCARIGPTGCWTDVILRETSANLDFLSVHNGFSPIGLAPLGGGDVGLPVRTVYAAMLAYPLVLTDLMNGLGARADQLAGPSASKIKIAATEWGPLFDVGPYSRLVDHVKTIGSALYVSSVFNVLLRNPRIEQAAAFKLLDTVVFGWLGPRSGVWTPKPAYYAFQLYGKNILPLLVDTSVYSPTYDSRSVIGVPAIQNVPYLDVISTTNSDRSSVVLLVTNRHFDRSITANIALKGFSSMGVATAWTLSGKGIDANSGTDLPPGFVTQAVASPDGRFDLGGPGETWVRSTNPSLSGSCMSYEFPPHSVTALVLTGGAYDFNSSGNCSNESQPSPPS